MLSKNRKKTGGVALFSHKYLRARVVFELPQASTNDKRLEILIVLLNFKDHQVLLCIVYRPLLWWLLGRRRRGTFKLQREIRFSHLDRRLQRTLDVRLHSKENSEGHAQIIRSYTSAAPSDTATQHQQLFDYFCVSDTSRTLSFDQISLASVSKHDLLLAFLHSYLPAYSFQTVTCRSFRGFNEQKFQEDLTRIDWSGRVRSRDVNEKVDILTS